MIVELDQRRNALDGKTQLTRVFDESQTLQSLFSISSLIAFCSLWWTDQADLLVIADGGHLNARLLRQ